MKCLSCFIREYPGVLKHTQVYWIKNWSTEALNTEVSFFLSSRDNQLPDDLRQRLSHCLSSIHDLMLKECRQLPFVGTTERTIKIRENQINPQSFLNTSSVGKENATNKKGANKEQKDPKITEIEKPNYPYSRSLLYEQIKNFGQEKSLSVSCLHVFVGPESFLRFMQSFWYLFTSKAAVCERDIIRLKKVLTTLNKTRDQAESMKEYINGLKQQYAESEKETKLLLEQVIRRSMILEKLRAKCGVPGSLPGYSHRDENDDIIKPDDERKLLYDGTLSKEKRFT